MELTHGYKQTEIGAIPEDWDVEPVGKAFDICNNLRLPISGTTREKMAGPFPYYGPTSIQGYINEYRVEGEYALIGEDGDHFLKWRTHSMTQLVSGQFNVNNHAHLVQGSRNLTEWFYYYFSNRDLTPHLTRQGAGRYKLTKSALLKISCALPPTKVEQQAIAKALTDADAFVESLEQLLAKKRQIKLGAMQELLTGRKRLPGFTGGWKKVRLGELALLSKMGINPASTPSSLFTHFSLPAFDAGGEPIVEQGRFIGSNKFIVPKEAVLLSKLNPRIPRIWAPDNIPDNAICSTEFLVLLPREETNRTYLAVLCTSPTIATQMELHAIGTTGSHQRIHPTQALAIELETTKDPDEQSAIARVISDMEAEVAGLEIKLAKARQIKQGMMHELLTGRIRLVRPSAQVLSFPVKEIASSAKVAHNPQINEAVVIAVLSAKFGSEKFPLGRFRRTKLSYLLHRHVDHETVGFMKKAAGPYNPRTRYGGAEKIAVQNRYVRIASTGKSEGFVADDNIAQAEGYFEKWYGAEVLIWLEQFRYQKNDALELLTTVDMACEDLSRLGKAATLSAVKQIIQDSPEWKAKLNRAVFSDHNIATTIQSCGQLFPIEEE